MGRRLGHVPALDGIRGIAIAAVVGRHFFSLPGGSLGVDLFFVLSGFLITTLLLEERERDGSISLRHFYERRARRLLPALFAVLLVATVFGWGLFSTGRLAAMIGGAAFYSLNLIGAFGHRDVFTNTPVNHLWTLSQEEQFYMLWPLVLILTLRRVRESRMVGLLVAVFAALVVYRIALLAGGSGYARLMFGPDTHADGLVIGCAAAFARRRDLRIPALLGWLSFAGLGVTAVLAGGLDHYVVALPAFELCAAAVLLAAVGPGLLGRLLSLQPLPWLGAISYSLYLWHEVARWLTAGQVIPGLALTVVLTLLSYYFVERPFRRPRAASSPEATPQQAVAEPA